MNSQLVEIETSFPMRFVLCTDIKKFPIKKEEDMKKVQVKNNNLYSGISIKPNIYIVGITVSMWKNMRLI